MEMSWTDGDRRGNPLGYNSESHLRLRPTPPFKLMTNRKQDTAGKMSVPLIAHFLGLLKRTILFGVRILCVIARLVLLMILRAFSNASV